MMADDIDRASDLAEFERQVGAARLADLARKAGRAECEDCGVAIPAERRLAYPAATRCVECQQAAEAGRRTRRH